VRQAARTLWLAVALAALASLAAAASVDFGMLLVARAGQGLGVGLLVAGGLADVGQRVPQSHAGRMTGALIAGTALGGLAGRALGYLGLVISWRWSFLVGGVVLAAVVAGALRGLSSGRVRRTREDPRAEATAPLSLILAGAFILFVSVAMFDLLPYRLARPPFSLPPLVGDLVFLTFVPATFAAGLAGRAVDRFGARAVALAVAATGSLLLLTALVESVLALALAALAAICGSVSLHVSHSGQAAAFGRRAVGRYLAAYYSGAALAAPLVAASFERFGWTGAVLPISAAWGVVALLALSRRESAAAPALPG
jgi:MFS transporter, YNFM family, putative membrane transport protein